MKTNSAAAIPHIEEVSPKKRIGSDSVTLRLRQGAIGGLLFILFVLVPVLSALHIMEPYNVTRLGRYLCFAIAGLGIDLIWGYTGVLTLCHALFFCIGGYALAMHLSLPQAGGDVRPEYHNIPQFFFFNNVDALPVWWKPFASLPVTLAAALLLPALVAGVVGFFIFRNRVRGVYFSIITQALAWGAFLAFSRNELLLGGTNGLTNFYKPLNSRSDWILGLYLLSAAVLIVGFTACRRLMRSRLGKVLVAVRDNESRLYFLGYRPDIYKTFAFCMAALLAAVGGMLYVPQNGIITPNVMRVEDSIWMVIWVAVGGRASLWGAVMGALLANFTYSAVTSDMPKTWPFIQAGLFLAILAFPGGIADLWLRLEREVKAGGRIAGAGMALVFSEAFLIADKLGFLPGILGAYAFIGVPAKYWVLLAVSALLGWRMTRAALPILVIAWFVVTEALGLMPASLSVLKYIVVLAGLAFYALFGSRFWKGVWNEHRISGRSQHAAG